MPGTSYLCLGDLEISNGNRTQTYVRNVGAGGVIAGHCDCEALEDDYGFIDPATDDAPWYDPNVAASADFLGLWINDMTLQNVIARTSDSRIDGGGVVGPLGLGKRGISCTGQMFATGPMGMAYGRRWLTQALAGSNCGNGCRGDDAEILPECPDTNDTADYAEFFRTLIGVGIADGPSFSKVADVPECYMQQVDFQLTSESPYLYAPSTNHLTSYTLAPNEEVDLLISTNAWLGDTTLVIRLENLSVIDDAGAVTVQMHPSYDGTCDNIQGNPCWTVVSNTLHPQEALLIDGQRSDLFRYNPTSKLNLPGYGSFTTPGFPFFTFPSIPPCTDMCIKFIADATGGATVTVDSYPREI